MLAKAQSGWVAREIEARNPGVRVELVIISTTGDQITDKPLHALGGKGLFTKELELALLAGTVDFAVHSFKDVPVTMPLVDTAELIIAAVPPREDPRDAWASVTSKSFRDLPAGAKVGTGSLRRRSQILHHRPDLAVEPIRGNIDTRLRKLREGQYDAVVLATAGLKRGGVMDETWMTPIDTADMLPAPGQGALALQCRRSAEATRRILGTMHDVASATCVELEREIVRQLEGDCHSPIAALATIQADRVLLRSAVGGREGVPPVAFAQAEAFLNESNAVIVAVMDVLEEQGARQRLLA